MYNQERAKRIGQPNPSLSFYELKLRFSYFLDYPVASPQLACLCVTGRCNAKCQYCADWQSGHDPRSDPTSRQIQGILSGLQSLGVEEVIFSGGEPLLRRDIYDLMEYARGLELQVRIITNGTGLSEAGMNRMAELGVAKIGISLDSLDPDRFAAIRGLDLRQVMRAIDMLATFKAERYQDLYVSLYATIVRLNIDDLVPIAEFAMERGLSVQYQPVHFAGTGISERVIARSWPTPLEIDRLGEVVRELVYKKTLGYPIGNREQFLSQIPGFFRRRTFHPERCFVGYTGITIDQDLGLRPCWAMEPVAHLGHSTTSLRDLWHSSEMRQVRKAIRLKRCPGCLYSCHLNKSYVPLRGSKRGAAQLLS